MKTLNKIITAAIADTDSQEKEILSLYIDPAFYSLAAIGDKVGVKKQWVSIVIGKFITNHIMSNEKISEAIDKFFYKGDEHVYLDTQVVAKNTYRILSKIGKDKYKYRVLFGSLVTSDSISAPTKKELYDLIKEEGLPLSIPPVSKEGSMTRNTFLYVTSRDGWFVNKKGDMIIGNRTSSLILNMCYYQTRKVTSIWDIYGAFVLCADADYMSKYSATTVKKLNLYIARNLHNISRFDDVCQIKKAVGYEESELGFTIYESESFMKTADKKKVVAKISKIISSLENN